MFDLGVHSKTASLTVSLDGQRFYIPDDIQRVRVTRTVGTTTGGLVDAWIEGERFVRFEGPPRPEMIPDYDDEGNEIPGSERLVWIAPCANIWERLEEVG